MENAKIIQLLKATIDINQQKAAENQLELLHKIIGFTPCLLQIVMTNTVEMPIRQAGAVYLKNQISQYWKEKEVESTSTLPFHIHEQDRAMIREAIVDATVIAPPILSVQLALCISYITKHDFPQRWTSIVEKISLYLQSPESSTWRGALLTLYQLVKIFEYKKADERSPLIEALNLLLPLVQDICYRLLPDNSEQSLALQKQILKIFYALVQFSFPLSLLTKGVFENWMNMFRSIIDSPIPEQCNQVDEEERPDLVWWKTKKWAHHIVTRVFERYGSPGSVTKEYKEFSEYYLKTFSAGVLEAIFKILFQHKQNIYVSPRVIQQCLLYLNIAVSHSFSWKFLKPHIMGIINDIIFPLMSHNEKDEELWNEDPHEYIRLKFDVFEDYVSPVIASQNLLNSVCKNRKDVLSKIWAFVISVLGNQGSTDSQKDGAFHMVGTVASILLKKKFYRQHLEEMLVKLVFPEFNSTTGFLRARACWMLHNFNTCPFKVPENLFQGINLLQNSLLNDQALPVKVEAAIGLQSIINNQDKAEVYMKPHIQAIALEMLKIIRETENDDLTCVMQKIVCTYPDEMMPIAVEMTLHLTDTFKQVIASGDSSEEKAITAMGILNTIDTILSVMDDQSEIKDRLEPLVLNVAVTILSQNIFEFYEEALCMMYTLSSSKISSNLWQAFELLYQTFEKDGNEFFTDMMPILHNFVTVDTPTFLSNQNHLVAIFNMCKTILTSLPGEDMECHAAKLLEVILLQCKGHVDQCIPTFVELCLNRLTQTIQTSELRTMCLQVIIAALYTNPRVLFQTLEALRIPNSGESFTRLFFQQWLKDSDCFLGVHDRKMTVLGWCTILSNPDIQPEVLRNLIEMIIPSLLVVFQGLKWAYAYKAQEEEEESEEEEEGDEEGFVASDDEDVEDEDPDYLQKLSARAKSACPFPVVSSTIEDDEDSEEDDDGEDDCDESHLESYSTFLDEEDSNIDEYVIFKNVLQNIQSIDANFYNALISPLNEEQKKELTEVFVLAERRKAAMESKAIEKKGGYQFQQKDVPSSFNFCSSNPFS